LDRLQVSLGHPNVNATGSIMRCEITRSWLPLFLRCLALARLKLANVLLSLAGNDNRDPLKLKRDASPGGVKDAQ
jgi:hypothetical protein